MTRRARLRDKAMERLHDSRLGWIGWLVDAAGWLSCRIAGHDTFPSAPGQCRHCGTPLDHEARKTARWRRVARWSDAISQLLLPPMFALSGAAAYPLLASKSTPPAGLLVAVVAVMAAGLAACVVTAVAHGYLRHAARDPRLGGRR